MLVAISKPIWSSISPLISHTPSLSLNQTIAFIIATQTKLGQVVSYETFTTYYLDYKFIFSSIR